jgi:hypothetical protein
MLGPELLFQANYSRVASQMLRETGHCRRGRESDELLQTRINAISGNTIGSNKPFIVTSLFGVMWVLTNGVDHENESTRKLGKAIDVQQVAQIPHHAVSIDASE